MPMSCHPPQEIWVEGLPLKIHKKVQRAHYMRENNWNRQQETLTAFYSEKKQIAVDSQHKHTYTLHTHTERLLYIKVVISKTNLNWKLKCSFKISWEVTDVEKKFHLKQHCVAANIPYVTLPHRFDMSVHPEREKILDSFCISTKQPITEHTWDSGTHGRWPVGSTWLVW